MDRYLIPRRITQRWELFPGWGWPQLGALGIGVLAGLLCFFIVSLLGVPLFVRVIAFLLPAGGVGFLGKPLPTAESPLDMLLAFRAYAQTRHLYLFDFGRDDA